MKAKDTVIKGKKLQLLGQQYEDDCPTCDFTHYALLAQAEITAPIFFKAGIKEVVEAIEEFGVLYKGNPWWDARLKEWGL